MTVNSETMKIKAEERSAMLAQLAADQAIEAAGKFLGRHRDLVATGVAAMIFSRERDRVYDETMTARIEGNLNDDYSLAPGLVVFFTQAGHDVLCQAAVREAQKAPHLAAYAAALQPTEDGTAYWLDMPFGTYSMGGGRGGCRFYGEVDMVEGRVIGGRDPINMGYDEILRIEGYSGEFWQNRNFTPQGTPIESR